MTHRLFVALASLFGVAIPVAAEPGYRWAVLRCTETGKRGWYQIPESAKSGDVLYPGEWK